MSDQEVGIVNLELYFPPHYVDQSELESFDGVSAGKYTIGLGQTKMGFCTDIEDVQSLCLTAVSRLIKKSGIDYSQIGRLDVGTESSVDKSKSVKTCLMRLFQQSGNTNVEGVDSTNACYGGTAALFNCINWAKVEGDGRFGVVVCADIAVYAKGNARPTGGAGAVAMLIGRNPAMTLEQGLKATHVEDVYDFYKPDLASEYPVVDGPLSIECYLRALDKCYQLYCQKALTKTGVKVNLDSFDGVCFHTPFCKLVQKSLARLALNDFVQLTEDERLTKHPELKPFLDIQLERSYFDKAVEKAFMQHSLSLFESKTKPSLYVATNVGNMYTPSLYGGLVSFIVSSTAKDLAGKRVGLFSYGSGLVASFFSVKFHTDDSPNSSLSNLCRSQNDVKARLESRIKVSPTEFDAELLRRESAHLAAPFAPTASPEDLFPGTWYLVSVDEKHRREYEVAKPVQNGH